MNRVATTTILISRLLLAFATIYVGGSYLLRCAMLLWAWRESARQRRYRVREAPEAAVSSGELPAISVIIPAYNEESSIVRTVRSLLSQKYPSLDIIVVSDGSTDGTLEILFTEFGMTPCDLPASSDIPAQAVRGVFRSATERRLRVIDKRNGGKADALNVGINYSAGDLVCAVDADVIFDAWAMYYLALAFIEDPSTVAATGMIRLQNGCRMGLTGPEKIRLPRRWVERFQVLEYSLAFGIGRLFFNLGSSHVVISGAFGLFARDVLLAVNGYNPNAIGEDMELVVRIHRYLREVGRRYRIEFVSDAVCYTEAPLTLRDLGKQRTRWQQGLLTTLRVHAALIGRPRYGVAGLLALPYFLLFELLSPIVEIAGWLIILFCWPFRLIESPDALMFLIVSAGLAATAAAAGVFIDDAYSQYYPRFRQVLAVAGYSLLEQFGYHQMMLYYRARAFYRFYSSVHLKGGWVSPARQTAVTDANGRSPGAGN